MSIVELVLISIGLSMDAFVVSIGKGISLNKITKKDVLVIALFFGFFQAFMPLIGYLLGSTFSDYIVNFDHWIAFILLSLVGGKMLIEAFDDEHDGEKETFKISEVFVLAIATSIDALAVGITLALIPDVEIVTSIVTIGIITFSLSYVGVIFGKKIGTKFGKIAEIFGGLVLVGIGTKILIEHLFF